MKGGAVMFKYLSSSMATVFGVAVYGDHFDKWWHNLTIWPLFRAAITIRAAKMWVYYRIHPGHRYHLVDTKLGYGYHDQLALLLHASMEILGSYIEEVGGVAELDKWTAELRGATGPEPQDGARNDQADRQDEALAIWQWWTRQRPADQKRQAELLHVLFGDDAKAMTWENGGEVGGEKISRAVFRERTPQEELQFEEMHGLEEKIWNDEQWMLKRLIDIRGSLWV